MKLYEAVNAIIDKFGLVPAELARGSNITKTRMGRFLKGESITTHGLDDLILSLDDVTYIYFLNQLALERNLQILERKAPTISEFVDSLDERETAELFDALANKTRKQADNEKRPRKKLIEA